MQHTLRHAVSAGYGGDGYEEGRPTAGALHGGAAGVAAGAAGGHGGRCTRLAGRTKAGRLKPLLCLDWGGQRPWRRTAHLAHDPEAMRPTVQKRCDASLTAALLKSQLGRPDATVDDGLAAHEPGSSYIGQCRTGVRNGWLAHLYRVVGFVRVARRPYVRRSRNPKEAPARFPSMLTDTPSVSVRIIQHQIDACSSKQTCSL